MSGSPRRRNKSSRGRKTDSQNQPKRNFNDSHHEDEAPLMSSQGGSPERERRSMSQECCQRTSISEWWTWR